MLSLWAHVALLNSEVYHSGQRADALPSRNMGRSVWDYRDEEEQRRSWLWVTRRRSCGWEAALVQ